MQCLWVQMRDICDPGGVNGWLAAGGIPKLFLSSALILSLSDMCFVLLRSLLFVVVAVFL